MDNVLSFPAKKNNDIDNSKYDIDHSKYDIVDDSIQNFLISVINNITNIDKNLLMEDDYHTQKMLAFLRETMIATIKKLQKEEHGIQNIAYDVIYFTEDTEEKIIELEDM